MEIYASYQECSDTLSISIFHVGYLTIGLSSNTAEICDSYGTKMGEHPQHWDIIDRRTKDIKDPTYVCIELENEDEPALRKMIDLLKEKKELTRKLKTLNIYDIFTDHGNEEDSVEQLVVSEERYLLNSRKQEISNRLSELLDDIEPYLARLKEITMPALQTQ